ncbi:MAG TPA: LPXTG cell wall anchor domain-containing protein [Methylomirabilota bacterium]|nr:LPXTG cell wall anchor domain-containing protein [Methylomirabilota bacterium]
MSWWQRVGWGDVALWLLLAGLVIGLLVAAWWPTRRRKGP